MMSSATIANGGGVAAGSLVAKKGLQSIGAAGLAATTDPLLVAAISGTAMASTGAVAGAVVGAVGIPVAESIKSSFRQGQETFDDEVDGREACLLSPVNCPLFDPDDNVVLANGFRESMRAAVAAFRIQQHY
ncbi:hypothetical protein PC119_g748 [Phytophthora cactorum]|nr:hypothetical protein PC114_g3092 [Phytophthora cactorum]KAG3041366.1 hypothetical protein PC119_g748 [Phytophthora cactorum]KAG3204983.1 hypothetical protein PC128_g1658 [Phytophthora cactorum]KAG4057588.1 hypothetical protein PC123_g7380 [Phytophthora cactorum]